MWWRIKSFFSFIWNTIKETDFPVWVNFIIILIVIVLIIILF